MRAKNFFQILFVLLVFCQLAKAQQPCAHEAMTQTWIEESGLDASELDNHYRSIAQLAETPDKSRALKIIPVVVHVIHKGETIGVGTNVSVARIESQLETLNDDFQRMNDDAGNTPSQFQSLAANAEIKFALAVIDPFGNSTSGITRHQYNSIPDNNFIENNIKPATTWDADNYMNLWVLDIPIAEYLGYSYLPTGTMVGSSRDGVVIDYAHFGFINGSNKGRTATHEIGHYLGLRHVWGSNDSNGNPIGCGSDDNVADTPNSDGPYYGCPNSGNSCSSNDMYMNFMDYVNDNCMNMFTAGQGNVMNGVLNGIRAELVAGNLTGEPEDCKNLSLADIDHGFDPTDDNTQWSILNQNNDERTWTFVQQSEDDWGPNTGVGMAVYFWNSSSSANDYLFSPCISFEKNHEYKITFSYACAEDVFSLYPEKLRVGISESNSASDFIVPSNDWVFDPVENAYPNYQTATLNYIQTGQDISASIGFHVYSAADQYALLLDDIRIEEVGTVSTQELKDEITFEVYPNPAIDEVVIELGDNNKGGELTLYSIEGKMLEMQPIVAAERSIVLDLSNYTEGIYLIKYQSGQNLSTHRIVKRR